MEFCAGLARGSYLVCIGWTALIVSGDVAVVGQIFIISMIANIIAGLFIGTTVDRYNRKLLAILAHLGIAASLVLLSTVLAHNENIPIFWFFLTVIFVNSFRLLYQGSHDGLIHANVNSEDLIYAVARFRSVHLIATAIGSAVAGVLIETISSTIGFLFSASTSIFLILAVVFIKGIIVRANTAGLIGFLQDISGGLALFRNNRILRSLTILAGISLPIGQLSNAILSSFILDDLGRSSDAFGLVDAAWPVGGMAAAAVLSLKLQALSKDNIEYLFALSVGILTIVFSFMSNIIPLVIGHAALGFSVWMCRIIIDGRILQICNAQTVGRTKIYIDMIFSFSAIIMCLSPTLYKMPSTSGYFLFWGAFITILTGLLWLMQISKRPSHF
jgi:hypothetical protein